MSFSLFPELRLWNRIRQVDGCWVAPQTMRSGYATVTINCRTRYAHRVMYEAAKGPIPAGLQIDHLCRNRACCNPDHLEAVTCRENLRRGVGVIGVNFRKTHCIAGHPFDVVNTKPRRDGKRDCRTCERKRMDTYRERRMARAAT